MQCKSNDNISATKYKHASSLVSHKTVKSRKIAMKKWQIVQRASRLTRLTGISSRLLLPFPHFLTTIPIPMNSVYASHSHGIPMRPMGIPVSCTLLHRVSKKTSTHIIGYKLRNSCPILIIFDTKIRHII